MIVVDTNVFSELMRTEPDAGVVGWYARRDVSSRLAISAVSVAEILAGIETMDDGRRRRNLADRTAAAIEQQYDTRILPFDGNAAPAYATIRARCRRAGRPIDALDAQIAAICLVNDATLATRNARDFAGCGIRVVNPWEAASGD
ncbi:MAG: type II toxin-antitoxin system VapC family toxin [Protaetiibacter sp.]